MFKEIDHFFSGNNCLFGQFDFLFYDIEQDQVINSLQTLLDRLPNNTGKARIKKRRNGAAKVSQKLSIPETYRYYSSDVGRWIVETYRRIVEFNFSISAATHNGYHDVIEISCNWESRAKEFNPSFVDIIATVHQDLYAALCSFGKPERLPAQISEVHKSKKKDSPYPVQFEYAISVFGWDFDERIKRQIARFTDDLTPFKRKCLQQYWWDLVYDFMQKESGIQLELSQGCPLYQNHDGPRVRILLQHDAASDYTRRYIFSVSADEKPISRVLAAACASDFTELFARHLNYRAGSVQQYIYCSEEDMQKQKDILKEIKESLLHGFSSGNRGQHRRVKWYPEFEELEEIGELRLFSPLGIRLIFRVAESEWRLKNRVVPISADWIIYADPVPLELSEIVSDTVSRLFNRFAHKKKSTQYENWDFYAPKKSGVQESERGAKWPSPQEYQEAMQNASSNLLDYQLKSAEVQLSNLGLPQAISGGFASVYKLSGGGKEWAVRCFLNPIRDQELRYSQISNFIESDSLPYTVGFEYVPDGILINGKAFPIVKMPWVKGVPLHVFLNHRYGNSELIVDLRAAFQKMHGDLLKEGMAHCDLQHGNIIVDNDELFLVDYDNVFIQPLEGMPSNELGHINYQHPARDRSDYGLYLDNFSAWVIDSSFACLLADPLLWKRLNGGDECLLFRRSDFLHPDKSAIFSFMECHADEHLQVRARRLREFVQMKPCEIPPLVEQVGT